MNQNTNSKTILGRIEGALLNSGLISAMSGSRVPDNLIRSFTKIHGQELLSLDQGKNEPPDPVFSGSAAFARAMISIVTEGNGAIKIVRRGQILDRVSLELLNCPELARTVEKFITDNLTLEAKQKLKSSLAAEIENRRGFLGDEQEIILRDIKREFPKGTAGQNVDVVFREFPDESGNNYNLVINRRIATDPVSDAVGKAFMSRKKALEQAETDIRAKIYEQGDLERQIADLRRILPVMDQKNRRLINGLDRDELRVTLGGDFVGITVNERNQPMVTIRKEVNEELAELPAEYKRRLIADHLYGDELPESLQEALKIKGVIWTVDDAIGYHPTDTKPVAEVKTPEPPAPETTATNAGSARLENYVKLL